MGENVHRWLAATAFVVVLLAVIGWRAVAAVDPRGIATATAARTPDLLPLMPYASNATDMTSAAPITHASIVLSRDPFIAQSAARSASIAPSPARRRTAVVAAEPWRVSATLLAGDRRAAVINDDLIYVGGALPGGGRLTSVERDRVVVTDAKGGVHTLAVKEGQD